MIRGTVALAVCLAGCTTLPSPSHSTHKFPENAYIGEPKGEFADRKYEVLGTVKSKADFPTLDPVNEEDALCANYFNKAVKDLVRRAKDKGADAVIQVSSVVFYEDGKMEAFPRPECSDDGEEGQVLVQGTAVKWIPIPEKEED